jgi:hypothetical protein
MGLRSAKFYKSGLPRCYLFAPNNMKWLVITKVRVYPEPHLTLMSLLVGDDSLSANKVGVARVALLVLTFYNSIPSFKAGEICG